MAEFFASRVSLGVACFFRSAYLLYYYDIYLKVQQELPHLPQSEINKKISESWRLLSVAEKSYYLEKAKLEKEGLDPVIHLYFVSFGFLLATYLKNEYKNSNKTHDYILKIHKTFLLEVYFK